MARSAPTPQAISDCGPPIVAIMAGTVMNGPVPTMFDMLIEIALSSPNRRGMRPCGPPAMDVAVPGWESKCEPVLTLCEQTEYCSLSTAGSTGGHLKRNHDSIAVTRLGFGWLTLGRWPVPVTEPWLWQAGPAPRANILSWRQCSRRGEPEWRRTSRPAPPPSSLNNYFSPGHGKRRENRSIPGR